MESLQILYIILAGVGAFFLLFSIFAGGDAEIDLDVGDIDFDISDAEAGADSASVFSLRTLATFLLGFGLAGWIAFRGEHGIGIQIISGFTTGLLISFLYFLVMKLMYGMQGSSIVSSRTLIGKQGIINIPTTSIGIAQLKVTTHSGFQEYSCKEKNDTKLKQNDLVNIISDLGGGTLLVEKV